MKKLEGDIGGRPVNNDDLMTLQEELSAAAFSPYAGRGPFIVSGCQVSGTGPYTVSAGLVMLDGEFRRFYGMSNATLPLQFQLGAFDFIDERPYETGGTKPCIRERPAVLVAPNTAYAGGEYLPFTALGGKRWEHVVKGASRDMGEIQTIAASTWHPANYDATGRGLPGTEAWGWALCNSQGGTENMMGRVVAGMLPSAAEYSAGVTGGVARVTLQATNLPPRPAGQSKVATQTGTGGYALLSNPGGWEAVDLPAGNGDSFDARAPYRALPMRQWVGY